MRPARLSIHLTDGNAPRPPQVLCSSAPEAGDPGAYDESKHLLPLEEAVGADRAEEWHAQMRAACRKARPAQARRPSLPARPRFCAPDELPRAPSA